MSVRKKACNTCCKRRVKCDKTRPNCHRCLRANLECGGYERPLHFRIAVPTKLDVASKIANSVESNAICVTSSARVDCSVPKFLHLTAFQQQFEFSCLFENFVWRGYGHGWMDKAASGQLSPLSLQAATALSQSNFGRFHHRNQSKTAGSNPYGKAVQALRGQLGRRDCHDLEELIIPIMLLLIHDSMSSSPKDSIFHVRGLVQLLMTCGPEKFRSQPLRSAFESCRATLITVGIITKKRCFLEDGRWRTIPWLPAGTKSPQHELADMLVMVPGMLEDETVTRDAPDGRRVVFDRVQLTLAELYRWRWRWQTQFSQTVGERAWVGERPSSIHAIPEGSVHFAVFERSTEIMLYNAVHMWLIALLYQLDPTNTPLCIMVAATTTRLQASEGLEQLSTPLLLPGMTFSMRDLALEVCKVFQYQCRQVHKNDASALFYLLPIGLAWSVLQSEEMFREWITNMLDESRVTKGYVLGQNVIGFGFYLSSGALQKVVNEENDVTTGHA